MLWFTKKDKDVEQTLRIRVSELETQCFQLERKIIELQVDQKFLRDKVLRKIQFKKEESDTPQDIYKGMLIPQP